MKLSKLLLLVPAMMLVGCKGEQPEPQPSGPKTEVTEAVFNAQVNEGEFLKPGYNKKITAKQIYDGETQTFTIEQDGDKYHGAVDEREMYFYVDPDSYRAQGKAYDIAGYYEKNDEWRVDVEQITLLQFAEITLNYCPFTVDFKDFTYDEQTKAYTAKDIVVEAHEFEDPDHTYEIPIKSVEYKFEDGQLLTINMVIETEEGDGIFTFETSEVGKISITLPEVE